MISNFGFQYVIEAGRVEFGSDRDIFRQYLDLNFACPDLRSGCESCPEDYVECSKYRGDKD